MSPHKRRILYASAFLLSAIAASAISAAFADEDHFDGAEAGDPTYLISELTFADASDTAILVSMSTRWSTEEYPGIAQCRALAFDADGHVRGEKDFSVQSVRPTSSLSSMPMDVDDGNAVNKVTAECAQATQPSGDARYMITSTRLAMDTDDDGDARMSFDVGWATDEPPLLQACTALIRDVAGVDAEYTFDLSVGPGPSYINLPGETAGGQVLSVNCHPY